eukprot:TRINITY_DN2965_c0_g1_i4.p1 TRINITY_DN2965_c0_g1~~TRINITY_DN2965_c0_g1_i4.p1  ORF type:complete len:201 (+),score=27.99 TRINITY_DN2965_c0_g1_i4:263-865(+)
MTMVPLILVFQSFNGPHQMYYNNQEQFQPGMGYQTASPMQQQQRPPLHQRTYHHPTTRHSGKVCTHWQKLGSCPNKRCPYAASHTARNSPRYAKHMKDAPAPDPVLEARPGPNALEIKDPSPNVTPPDSREPTPPKLQARPFALEIKDPEAKPEEFGNETQTDSTEIVAEEEKTADDAFLESTTAEAPRGRSRFANMFGK